mgnify:CR=1 FL=1
MAKLIREKVGRSFGYEWTSMAYQEENASSSTSIIFILAIVVAFLILAAQYESWTDPFAVIMGLPIALLGVVIGVMVMNLPISVYTQIGVVLLIALAAKNAILITEFALERRQSGMSIVSAAVLGASARLRPILMTSLAMVIGLLPMMFASGVGANGNSTLGSGAIGGMLIGMICQIFTVPAMFVAFQHLQEKIKPIEWHDTDNTELESEIEQYTK